MLKQLQVRNFRSLSDATFEPRPIELIIGPNGSGKTDLCKAMQFLGLSATEPLDVAASHCFGKPSVANENRYYDPSHLIATGDLLIADDKCQFEYALSMAKPETMEHRIERLSESLRVSGGPYGSGAQVLVGYGSETLFLNEEHFRLGAKRPHELIHTGAYGTGILARQSGDAYSGCAAFARYIRDWRYFHFEPSAFGRTSDASTIYTLMPDGANLRLLMKELCSDDETALNRFVREAKNRSGSRILPERFVAIAYAMMTATTMASTVVIEEPENGLHVSLYKEVMRLAEEAADRGVQVVFTTHSPYFIDLFDRRLDAITLCERTENGSRIEKADPEWLKEVVRRFELGEAYFRGLMRRPASKGVN